MLIDHCVVLLFPVGRLEGGGCGFVGVCPGLCGLRRVLWFVNSPGFLLWIILLKGIQLHGIFVLGIGLRALLPLVVLVPILLFLIGHWRPRYWNWVNRQYCSCSGLEGLAILI